MTRILLLLVPVLSGACTDVDGGFRNVPSLIAVEADEPLQRNGVIFLTLMGALDSDQVLVTVDGGSAPIETRYCQDECDPEDNDACVSQRCIVIARPAALIPPSASVFARTVDGGAESLVTVEVMDAFDTEAPVVESPIVERRDDGLIAIGLHPEDGAAAQVVVSGDGQVVDILPRDMTSAVVASEESCFLVVVLDFAGQEGRSDIVCVEPTSGCQSTQTPQFFFVLLALIFVPRRRL